MGEHRRLPAVGDLRSPWLPDGNTRWRHRALGQRWRKHPVTPPLVVVSGPPYSGHPPSPSRWRALLVYRSSLRTPSRKR